MFISRTPYRISFFGGGTDYPDWYLKNGGMVLSASINKFCYITLRHLPPFFEHKIRVVYSKIELCQRYQDINHPAVRETLRYLDMDDGLEIHYDGDLPARCGIGSSSAFTVGLLHAIYALKGIMPSKKRLAMESIHIEQKMIKETVGSQDQVATAHGGLNKIQFFKNGEIIIHPVVVTRDRAEELNSQLMLFHTGISRIASDVASTYVPNIQKKKDHLMRMHEMVNRGLTILTGNHDMIEFGHLLDEAWKEKRKLSPEVSNTVIDQIYARAKESGAVGGKITGAGGGGFLLLFVPPARKKQVRKELEELVYVPFRFDYYGSQIIVFEPHLDKHNEIKR